MTLEEAIDFILNKIQIDVRFCSDEDIEKTEAALKLAISALEKQMPKQPKYEDVGNVYGAIKRTCTACGDVCMVSKGAKPYEHYCRQCGQALEWSENNG